MEGEEEEEHQQEEEQEDKKKERFDEFSRIKKCFLCRELVR